MSDKKIDKMRTGLGKGFDALMPKDLDLIIGKQSGDRVQNLFINDIEPNPDQPRKNFDLTKLTELSDSIKQYGVLQPIIVVNGLASGDKYMIIAGERRWRAARIAGLSKIPVVVRSSEQLEQLEISIVENIQRVDLNPLEQAESIGKLHEVFGVSYSDIAKRLNKAESTVNNIVRLLNLPEKARDALSSGLISEGHARAILALKDFPEKQDELLKLIHEKGWSVRQAEQYAVATKADNKDSKKAQRRVASTNIHTKRLSDILNYPVSVSNMAKGGRLVIRFESDEDFDRLISLLETVKANERSQI